MSLEVMAAGGESGAVDFDRVKAFDDKIGLEQADRKTQLAHEVAPPIIRELDLTTDRTLAEKDIVSLTSDIERLAETYPEDQFKAECEKLDKAIEDKLFLPQEVNFIIKLRDILAYAYRQRDRLNENDRLKIENLKTEFKNSVKDQASCQRKMGTIGVIFATASFLVGLGTVVAPDALKKAVEIGAGQVPTLGSLFTSPLQANMKLQGGAESLSLNSLQQEQAKKQSEGNSEQEKSRVLDKAIEAADSAARAR